MTSMNGKTRLQELVEQRLTSYPGAHPNEKWKLETDLTKCTPRETQEMHRLGTSPEQLMEMGLNRGQVAHVLFGYRHTPQKGGRYGK